MAGSKPRILLVGGDGGYSGVPTYLRQMSEALSDQAEITIVSDENLGGYDFARQMGLRHIIVRGLATGTGMISARKKLRDIIRLERPDLTWAHARGAVMLLRSMKGIQTPCACTLHGLPFGAGHRALASEISRWIEKLLIRNSSMPLVFLSEDALNNYIKNLGNYGLSDRLYVIENCSNIGPISNCQNQMNDAVNVLMTGRFAYQKNYGLAARIAKNLPSNFNITICGSETGSPKMRRLFLDVSHKVSLVGPVDDVRPYLSNADLFLLTSRYEGMPIGALEAMEVGLPVALPGIPGTREICETHPFCCEIDPENPKETAKRIVDLYQRFRINPQEHRAQIRGRWESRFSPEMWRARIKKVTAELLQADPS